MKKIIAAVVAASALLGVTQAFAYQQTTVTTTRTYTSHRPVHDDAWRHEQWVREQQHRRWVEAHHHNVYRGY